MRAASPVDHEDDLAGCMFDVDDDLGDEGAHSLVLGEGCEKFKLFSVEGTRLNEGRRPLRRGKRDVGHRAQPGNSYGKSAHIANRAMKDFAALKQAALASGNVDETTYDRVVNARSMVGRGVRGA